MGLWSWLKGRGVGETRSDGSLSPVSVTDQTISYDKFSLAWSAITGYAIAVPVLRNQSTGEEQIIGRVLELHSAGGVQTVPDMQGSAAWFDALVQTVKERIPGREVESVLRRMRPGAYR